ncbi:MAG: response regulator transcription factor [Candidatus Dormibacteraeota bacterium]|nr:response regulator transcription factor [Candidatus Dormibacteraeota bacterium]
MAPATGVVVGSEGIREAGSLPRVLLIDRQPLFVEALGSLLATPPLRAATAIATRSDDAVARAVSGSVDLVVCDVEAEPLDGPALVHALASQTPRVPVILLGELDQISSALPLLLEGASGLLTKDVATADLMAGVEAALAGHQVLGANLLPFAFAPRAVAAPPAASAGDRLSPAEREVLALIGRGRSVVEIAGIRRTSQKTVRNHMASIYRKLGLNNRVEAMLFAARIGLSGEAGGGAQQVWADSPEVSGTHALERVAIPIASDPGRWDDP